MTDYAPKSDAAQEAISARKRQHLEAKRSHTATCSCQMCSRFGCTPSKPCILCQSVKK